VAVQDRQLHHDLLQVGTLSSAGPSGVAEENAAVPPSALYRAVWRWHFYTGLICLPFLVTMSITGALYLFRVEIESLVYRDLLTVVASPPRRALLSFLALALSAHRDRHSLCLRQRQLTAPRSASRP
jgi:hypothetical protein